MPGGIRPLALNITARQTYSLGLWDVTWGLSGV